MIVQLIDPPSDRIVTLEQMKAHLRVDHTDDDELIEALTVAAEQRLDGPGGICGRAFRPQRLRVSMRGFGPSICLPFPPLIAVESLTYLDDQGDERTFAETDQWRVVGIGSKEGGSILPLNGVSWPSLYATPDPDLVRVTFTAGYYSAASPGDDLVPAPIKHAVKLIVGDWYDHRSSSVIGTVAGPTPHGVEMLVAPFRVTGAYMAV